VRLIIDSHLDLSWNALSWNRDLTQSITDVRKSEALMADDDARGHATVTLPELRRGGVAVCCGTLLARAKPHVRPTRKIDLDVATQEIACAIARGQLSYYRLLAERNEISFITNRLELQAHFGRWQERGSQNNRLPVGLILAMEGGDPIVSPAQAEQWWADGLRTVGLAHYGKSHYAVGTGDNGPLTLKGKELLKEFGRLGMILDATHSSDISFYQAMDLFPGPVMASHNNCRALVPGDRQFADEQIKLLIQREAVIGVAFDAWMLQANFVIGQTKGSTVPLTAVADHIDHICQLAGNANHVAFGTDLDGGFGTEQSPNGLETIADLQNFESILTARGYSALDIDRIFHGNWLRFFLRFLP
jgi:membrane dipeptidase